MSDTIHASHLGTCFVSEESSFGTPGTERRCHIVADSGSIDPTQAEVDVMPLRARPFDYRTSVLGFKACAVTLSHYCQPPTTVLAAGATPDADAAAPLRVLMRCVLGGESVAAGTDVATGTSDDEFDVTTGQGARMPAGQIVLVTDPADGLVPARVTSRVTDTLQIWPSLSGAPATGADVNNTVTWYLTRTNSKSLSVALCSAQDTDRQWRAVGCTGNMTIKFERGALVTCDFELQGASWTGPSALGLSVAHAADPMAAPLAARNAVLILQPPATTTRVNHVVDTFEAKITTGNVHLESLTGGVEGKRAAFRGEGLQGSALEVTFTAPVNTSYETWYQARTDLSAMLYVPFDVSGGGRRLIVLDVPLCQIVGKPKAGRGAANADKVTVTLKAKLDTSGAQSSELSEAPFRIATG